MKLKQRPEDFVVEEMDSIVPAAIGRFAIYRLAKKGIGTIEAARRIAREFRVAREAIGFGGLKDKWAATEQKVSIENGPDRNLKTDTFELSYLGRSDSAVGRAGFDRNRFTIVVRDLWEGDVRHWRKVLDEIREDGLPNYFDSQRFGSVTDDFIARRMMRGQWEEALRLAIGTPRQEDRGKARKVKATLREHWGDWEKCSALPPPEGRIAKLLSRKPDAWAAAFELLDKHLRLLYASAYQSWLWNRALERLLQAHVMPSQLFRKAYAQGELLFYRRLPARERERFLAMKIPFPRRGVKFDDSEVEQAVTQVIKEEGFELKDLRIPGKSTYFGRGERAAVVVPQGMSATEPESDELNAGRLKLTLRFELPKGSYATVLIKRVFH